MLDLFRQLLDDLKCWRLRLSGSRQLKDGEALPTRPGSYHAPRDWVGQPIPCKVGPPLIGGRFASSGGHGVILSRDDS